MDYKMNTSRTQKEIKNNFKYKKADLDKRFLAVVIDTIIIVIFSTIIMWIISIMFYDLRFVSENAINIIQTILKFSYYVSLLIYLNGQTIGKSFMKIRVVNYIKLTSKYKKYNNLDIEWHQPIVRFLGEILSVFLLFTGYLYIFINKDNRGLHDLIAGTIVIDEDYEVLMDYNIISKL